MAKGKGWKKENVIKLLRPLFKLGYSINKACIIAGIPQPTVQTWVAKDEELRLQINVWQNEISLIARKNWKKAIKKGVPTKHGPDLYSPSKEWLERREKDDFSTRSEVEVTDFKKVVDNANKFVQ